ncbi:MAG: tol-pal system-associated acyl-CoA thioesterase [Zetaproteobacteria bacterium]|nr:MAG: tol-pal system-associated acyl-CoA thioesterase [Zetaproteobacteria bacterium]
MTGVVHSMNIRIYYEDTDHGGVVYYANYLKFMERARTEFLRAGGIDQQQVEQEYGLLFAVTEAHLRYHHPARFNDLIRVESRVAHYSGAQVLFDQRVVHAQHNRLLVSAKIRLASISREGKVRRMPQHLRAFFRHHLCPAKELP